MNIQKVKIKQLKRAEYNPRKTLTPQDEEYQKLKKSIVDFGYVVPIIINSDYTVIGGHQGLTVLEDLGYEEIECNVLDLDKKQEKILNLALNKIDGYWDNDKLKELFDELELTEAELLATGFDLSEIDELNTDFISDLLEEEFSTTDRQLDKFAITFNIPKEYEGDFSKYIKSNGKDELVELLVEKVKKDVK